MHFIREWAQFAFNTAVFVCLIAHSIRLKSMETAIIALMKITGLIDEIRGHKTTKGEIIK